MSILRASLFALVGVVFFVYWVVVDPTYEQTESMKDWNVVLGFSAAVLLLAFAIPLFAQLGPGPSVFQTSLFPAAGGAFVSLSNIVEDGLQMDWAFFGFVLGSLIVLVGLLVLTVKIAVGDRGGHRFLALIPAGTMAAWIFFVAAGGVLMLITWLAAAALALVLPSRTATQVSSTT